MTKACLYCNKEFEAKTLRKVYCGKTCCNKVSAERTAKTYVCKCCGKEFKPKAPDRTKYCSRECAYKDMAAKPKEKKPPNCVICGKQFDGRIDNKYCSNECYKQYSHQAYLEYKQTNEYKQNLEKQKEKYIPADIKIKTCKECGSVFKTRRITAEYCSDKCRNEVNKRNHKEQKDKRRAVKKNAFVQRVNRKDIYLRDKGKCGICGKRIDLKIKYPHLLSLTIDHIIPLACGGTHEPKNVQIAHFICNSKKSAGTIQGGEQLRLC